MQEEAFVLVLVQMSDKASLHFKNAVSFSIWILPLTLSPLLKLISLSPWAEYDLVATKTRPGTALYRRLRWLPEVTALPVDPTLSRGRHTDTR